MASSGAETEPVSTQRGDKDEREATLVSDGSAFSVPVAQGG